MKAPPTTKGRGRCSPDKVFRRVRRQYLASADGIDSVAPRTTRPVQYRQRPPPPPTDDQVQQLIEPLGVAARGFSGHAATTVDADDRDGWERPCRYVNRPPLAYGRLRQMDSGELAFALKTPW